MVCQSSLAIAFEHAQCAHTRKVEIMPAGHCDQYDPQQGKCNAEIKIVHINKIGAPSLCVECFRKVEDEIHAECDLDKQQLAEAIERQATMMNEETDPGMREYMVQLQENMSEALLDHDIERKMRIAHFRSSQGVWADG